MVFVALPRNRESELVEMIPESVVQRLEREWRMIDRERPQQPERQPQENVKLPRLKVGRVDV